MMMPSIFGENLFDDWMNDATKRSAKPSTIMKTDVKETEGAYKIAIELPGYKKEDVNVKFENGTLSVTASSVKESEDKKDGRYIRRERYQGSCTRQFYVGRNIRKQDITARMHDGVLELTVPKKGAQEIEAEKSIAID